MSQRNNFKNENNNSEDEIESFNEEEEDNDLFMNKKELVHIENDTSINVDKSFDDDHSKTSTLKKGGLIINNISATNEQFSKDIDFSDKKIVDQNFFSQQIKAELGEYNDTENKIEQKGVNNLKKSQNGLKINPTNYFETFNNLALDDKNNNNNNLQKNNINMLNNVAIDKNYIINENNSKKSNEYSISNFNHSYLGSNTINKIFDQKNFSNEFKTQYNELESNFINLSAQYKKLKAEYDDINNSNKSLLDLLSYWQKFYLEVKEIVLPEGKKNNSDFSINDYMDDPYRIQVIDEVKKLIIISRDKVHNNFYKISDINFTILKDESYKKLEQKNKDNNFVPKKVESFNIKVEIIKSDDANENINDLKISKKFLDESDDLDFPPIRYDSEKVNIGINTDEKFMEKQKIFKFDTKLLSICKYNNDFEIKGSEINNIQQKQENPMIKKKISNTTNKNKNKGKDFQIITLEQMNIKGKPYLPKKFKKNTTFKFACIQTDISKEQINELIIFKNENEIIKKQLEDKINTLNEFINNSENRNNNILNKNISNNKIKNNKENNSPNKNSNNNSKMFLPEMIPPENTYKIFMNCIKNFKYEEGMYQKFIVEDDIINLKNFVEKMEKYLIGSSLPVLKATKRKDYIIHSKLNNESNKKKYKDNILSSIRPKYSNISIKKRNTSDSKNYYERSNSVINNNNIIFNKYKASIMSLKDN